MAAEESVVINTLLVGAREFVAGVQAEVGVLRELAAAAGLTAKEMESTGAKTFVANQALFTTRRVAYAGTLALLAAGGAALKLGWNYSNAMQQARVALAPVFADTKSLNRELEYLYRFSSFTPFQFKDVTIAFRQLYASLKGAPGITDPLKEANSTIKSLTDSLSFAGKTSPQALQRVSLAIQHMAYQGHLTGYAVNQLSRDGIPMLRILNKELGLTGDQIHNIGKLNVPVQTVLDAINKFVATTPGFANAAFRQATMTLHGAFTTFKDFLSQAVAGSQGGVFGGLTRFFQGVDKALQPLVNNNKPITLIALVSAIDSVLSPKTHLVLDFFNLLSGIFDSIRFSVHALGVAIGWLLTPLGLLNGGGHASQQVFRVLGYVLGVYLTALALFKIYAYGAAAAQSVWTGVMWAGWVAMRAFTLAMAAWDFILLVTSSELGVVGALAAVFGFEVEWMSGSMWLATAATAAWDAATAGLAATMGILEVLMGPVGWTVLAIAAITTLYFKWKWFHDEVNSLFGWVEKHKLLLASFFLPAIGPLIVIYKMLKEIRNLVNDIRHGASWKNLLPSIPGITQHGGSTWSKIGGVAKDLIPFAGFFAGGGTLDRSGFALVGERGPELLQLPSGTRVTPLDGGGSISSIGGALSGLVIKVYPQDIYLDGKKVGSVLATAVTDLEARL